MSVFGESLKTSIDKKLKKKKKKKSKLSTLIIVKKDGPELSEDSKYQKWLSTVPGFLEGCTKVNDNDTKLYDYQIAHMLNTSKFRIINKSRQIGFSLSISGESLARSHLRNINNSVIISLNKDEAAEKIIGCQMLYESMPLAFQKKRITDNKHSQVFKNQKGNVTRILSTAQRPPRGKGHNTDVYFDEYAFWLFASKIFTASVPVITRGTGSLTIGSTPLGASGKFHEILTGLNSYAQFSRQNIPWWHCPDLCNDIKNAFKECPKMTSEERVNKFATDIMRLIFATFPLDDFQQEYELAFIDENVSYFPVSVVNNCSFQDEDETEYDITDKNNELVISKQNKTSIQMKYSDIKFFKCKDIEELSYRIQNGDISRNLLAGYDVGRKKDKSELTVIEEIHLNDTTTLQIVRFILQFDRQKFEYQKKYLFDLMTNIPIIKLGIDANGLGMNLAEDLDTKFPGRVESVSMQTEWKDKAVQSLKIRFEEQLIAIPDDIDLKKQIGSIKKKVSDTGFVRYDAEKDKDHHGDKFWSLTLASQMSVVDLGLRTSLGNHISAGTRSLVSLGNSIKSNSEANMKSALIYVPKNSYSDIPEISSIPIVGDLLFPGNNLSLESSWDQQLNGFHTATRKR
jgi:phage FluMu gp28-like protein